MSGPLAGIRVLDLSRVLAGPWATQMLADLGADVLKIEHPGQGDDTRGWGPPFLCEADGQPGDAAYFLCTNRGKRSLCLDFSTPDGRRALLEMLAGCDVLVENYRPGGLKKYGLDYDSLRALHPSLIYCSITGFGQTGPYADKPGYDLLIQGLGGLMSITGSAAGGPQKVGVAVVDLVTGLYASTAILAALHHRLGTGEGQHIDLALLDCQVAMLANQASNWLVSGRDPVRLGNAHPNIVPYESFATRDGHLIVAVGNDAQFARLCEVIGHPQWATDERFVRNAGRVAHRDALLLPLREVLRQRDTADWVERLSTARVPCGPVNSVAQVFADPQVRHREMLRTLRREDGTQVPVVANPIRFSKTPVAYLRPPPRLGEN